MVSAPAGKSKLKKAVDFLVAKLVTVYLGIQKIADEIRRWDRGVAPSTIKLRYSLIASEAARAVLGFRGSARLHTLGPPLKLGSVLQGHPYHPADHLYRILTGYIGHEIGPPGWPNRLSNSRCDHGADQGVFPPFELRKRRKTPQRPDCEPNGVFLPVRSLAV